MSKFYFKNSALGAEFKICITVQESLLSVSCDNYFLKDFHELKQAKEMNHSTLSSYLWHMHNFKHYTIRQIVGGKIVLKIFKQLSNYSQHVWFASNKRRKKNCVKCKREKDLDADVNQHFIAKCTT